MNNILNCCLLSLLFLCGSCSGRSHSDGEAQDLPTGKVMAAVKCLADPGLSYAVYLPSSYKDEEKIPVYIAFDSDGKGSYPVTLYSSLAEKYRFILMGSNDSQNGRSMEELNRIATGMVQEAKTRFGADSTRLYLAGFSGGARVAGLIGMYMQRVTGIIGCGAGLSSAGQPPVYQFRYVAMAGEADPNLSELILQDEALTGAGWDHTLMVIPGGHQWPPVEEMEKAILRLRGELPPLPAPPVSLKDYYEIDKETSLQQEIIRHFDAGDTTWMKKEIASLRYREQHGVRKADSLMAKRLTAFLGLVSWSKTTNELQQNQLDRAFLSLTIYRLIEPENPAVDSLFKVYQQKRNP